MNWNRWGIGVCLCLVLAGCGAGSEQTSTGDRTASGTSAAVPTTASTSAGLMAQARPRLFEPPLETIAVAPGHSATRQALFGDLHIHTQYSFDAYAFGTIATPADAYRYARGEAIRHPAGFDMQLRAPLDFYGVTDHAMFLGAVPAAADTSTEFSKLELARPFHNLNRPENLTAASSAERSRRFSTFIPDTVRGILDGTVDRELLNDIARSAWRDTIDAAEQFNDPGQFTTFIAYEYTSTTDERGNLHRNVIFRNGDRVPDVPFSRFHSQNPEGLWDWMDQLRARGMESLAIPHNSNGSNGAMFMLTNWAGDPIDSDYANQRMRNEPLVEVTQVKGTSDTHPALSPNDEWADFEIMPYRISTTLPSQPPGSYVRDAYLRGLTLEAGIGVNPYKFGLIGSSDTHTGAGSFDEDNFFSKIGILDATPAQRGSVPLDPEAAAVAIENKAAKQIGTDVYREGALQHWSASGLAGVWAEENTRDSIFDAFRRKETFATSGPRLRVRLFAGYGFSKDLTAHPDWIERAYANGVTMGGDLHARIGQVPSFVVWAARDARSAPLQRLQIIKGMVVDGETRESVYDVACSDGLAVDPATHRCPDNGASVDLDTCRFSGDKGAAELMTVWQDPDFEADQRAFYYVRALENPTCRWSTWDAIRTGVPPRPDLHATIQERVWSSPIWVVPGGE
ncbi:MAG: DUF3604 domain-containing protein [Pseudomonadales bacterium]